MHAFQRSSLTGLAAAAIALALAGCAGPHGPHGPQGTPGAHEHGHGGPGAGPGGGGPMGMMMKGRMGAASLSPTQGNAVRGLIVFHEMDGRLMVHAKVSGLKPNAEHGFHVHETGSCASTDGSSAGGHFNPDGKPHGPQGAPHHAGDLPALRADAAGVADQKFTVSGVTLAEGATSLQGRSVIVHAMPDDYTTQPTGNSGARVACGVIAVHQ